GARRPAPRASGRRGPAARRSRSPPRTREGWTSGGVWAGPLRPGGRDGPRSRSSARPSSALEHREECFLRDFDLPDLLHALLSFLLALEQLPLPRDVAAVALRRHVLAHRL